MDFRNSTKMFFSSRSRCPALWWIVHILKWRDKLGSVVQRKVFCLQKFTSSQRTELCIIHSLNLEILECNCPGLTVSRKLKIDYRFSLYVLVWPSISIRKEMECSPFQPLLSSSLCIIWRTNCYRLYCARRQKFNHDLLQIDQVLPHFHWNTKCLLDDIKHGLHIKL